MRPQSIDDQSLLSSIERVFRLYGYSGASLSNLSEATGLERASLYHRFPGGKLEMALAVANNVVADFKKNVFDVIDSSEGVEVKIGMVKTFLASFYENGTLSCLLETLSLTSTDEGLRAGLKAAMLGWIDSFTQLAILCGCSTRKASKQALKAIVHIQGSLVVSRVLCTDKPFLNTLNLLQSLLEGQKILAHAKNALEQAKPGRPRSDFLRKKS